MPLTAVLTWYSYDYLIPSDPGLVTDGPDWQPYQHGITATRYLTTLAWQTPATLFTVAYTGAVKNRLPRKAVVRFAVVAAVLAGGIFGYRDAVGQLRFM